VKTKIKIWHFLVFLYLLLIVFRIEYIFDLLALCFQFIKLLFAKEQNISSQIDFKMVDVFVSLILVFLIPILLLTVKKLRHFMSLQIGFAEVVIILLLTGFLFAPLITRQNPDFQKNISVTKLLPPFSSVKFIQLKDKSSKEVNQLEKFKNMKSSVIPESYDESIIFLDSLKVVSALKLGAQDSVLVNPYVEYYQKETSQKIFLSDLITLNNQPIIKEKLFILGSDEFGRDIFTRIIYGSRISLLVGFGSVLLSLIIGIGFAFIASQNGKFIDLLFSRLTDLFLTFPMIFLVILILALFGSNLLSVIIVLGLSGWMSLFKIVKSEIASIKTKEYFLSAELIGLKSKKLLIREILPVIIAPVIVNLIFLFSNVILAESALSYLGLGTGVTYPSWGSMIEAGQEYITKSWWMIFIPGIILILTLLSINNLGRRLNKFYNPKLTL
jgi:peptide/nickel transport system permease protein